MKQPRPGRLDTQMKLSWVDQEGILHTEEVSVEEYLRVMSGQGSTPKPDPVKRVLDRFNQIWESTFRLLRS